MIFAASSHFVPQRSSNRVTSEQGYDLVADHYDQWAWQHFWRENEFPIMLGLLIRAAPKLGVLDVGVGTGAFLSYALPCLNADVPLAGIDVSAGMLKCARSRLGSRATLVQGDVQNGLPFDNQSFDAIVMMRVANHVFNFDKAIAEVGRVLSPGGILIATDLAEEFDYDCTRIPTSKITVSIETHKHLQLDWQRALIAAEFFDPKFFRYGYSDLRDPFAGGLNHKLDRSGRSIFQIITGYKRAIAHQRSK
jgi:ubiquinone/menaquinone biosynthesis C-methylase UbiE